MADEIVNSNLAPTPETSNVDRGSGEEVVFDSPKNMDEIDYLNEGDDSEGVALDGYITDEPEATDEPKAKADMDDAVDSTVKPEKPEVSEDELKMKSILKMMENPKILEAIKKVQDAENNAQNTATAEPPKQVADIEADFSEEDLKDPQTFAKSIIKRVVQEITNKVNDVNKNLEPLKNEYGKMVFNQECSKIAKKYGDEAKAFLTKGTPEFESMKSKFLSNPSLTLEEAFLLVKPQVTDRMVAKGVNSAIERGREQSLRVTGNKTPEVQTSNKPMSARESILAAFKEHGISI